MTLDCDILTCVNCVFFPLSSLKILCTSIYSASFGGENKFKFKFKTEYTEYILYICEVVNIPIKNKFTTNM